MKNSAVAEATPTAEMETPFCREAILRVLDRAPDGYKLLAQLIDDPCELVRDYDPNSQENAPSAPGNSCHTRPRASKLHEMLRTWLIAGLKQESSQRLGSVPRS
jgi:hypothetical protein